ncbi:glucosaminidase domain-containing protein [Furfurilactobacillus cerevisiae]
MKRLAIAVSVIGLILGLCEPGRAMNKTDFLMQVESGAQQNWAHYGILPSVTGAQAILESGWGTSQLATNAHNLFGIKGANIDGATVRMPTREVVNGYSLSVWANFRAYPSFIESIADHGQFLSVNSRYHNVLGERDAWLAAQKLQSDGYATDPAYADELMQIIRANNLTRWDQEKSDIGQHPTVAAPNSVETSDSANQPRQQDTLRRYVIQPGDSWWRISMASGISMGRISQVSQTPIRWWIYPGQWLWLPQMKDYTVQQGDTLHRIEKTLQLPIDSLAKVNHRAPQSHLTVGTKLELPAAV